MNSQRPSRGVPVMISTLLLGRGRKANLRPVFQPKPPRLQIGITAASALPFGPSEFSLDSGCLQNSIDNTSVLRR